MSKLMIKGVDAKGDCVIICVKCWNEGNKGVRATVYIVNEWVCENHAKKYKESFEKHGYEG